MLTISSSCFFSSSASAMRQVVTCLTSSRGLPMYSFYEKEDEKKIVVAVVMVLLYDTVTVSMNKKEG